MADTFTFSLVSPERELVSEEVSSVVVPGAEGDFGVLPNHAPVIARLRPGLVTVTKDGEVKRYFVYHGFAEVTQSSLSVLAEDAQPVEELKGDGLADKIKDAEEDVSVAKDALEKALAEEILSHLKAVEDTLAAL
ncbi:MAG: F0F1 ATP synthase subunit epsilon [Alphaproteobacteria bacterium]|nr:MAG: F0F1 ATP synthase subunit epsilon [Alphaproteobacteria bacterium]